jgi:hypothetical protein
MMYYSYTIDKKYGSAFLLPPTAPNPRIVGGHKKGGVKPYLVV